MISALSWADTREGVSDLRRYWHGRADDFTTDELDAFLCTLPDDSATKKAANGWDVEMSTLLSAMTVDSIRQMAMGMGGKKMPKDKMLVPHLNGEGTRRNEEHNKLREQLKKSMN